MNSAESIRQPTAALKPVKKNGTVIKHNGVISSYEVKKLNDNIPQAAMPVPFRSLVVAQAAEALPQRKRKDKLAKKPKQPKTKVGTAIEGELEAIEETKVFGEEASVENTKHVEETKHVHEKGPAEQSKAVDVTEKGKDSNEELENATNQTESQEDVKVREFDKETATFDHTAILGPKPLPKPGVTLDAPLIPCPAGSTIRELMHALARYGTAQVARFIQAQAVPKSAKGAALLTVDMVVLRPSASVFGLLFPLRGYVNSNAWVFCHNQTIMPKTKARRHRGPQTLAIVSVQNVSEISVEISEGGYSVTKLLGRGAGEDREAPYPRISDSSAAVSRMAAASCPTMDATVGSCESISDSVIAEMEEETECSVDANEVCTTYEDLRCTEPNMTSDANLQEETECSVDSRELFTPSESLRHKGHMGSDSKAERQHISTSSYVDAHSAMKGALSGFTMEGKSTQELMEHLESLAELSEILNDQVQKTVKALKAAMA